LFAHKRLISRGIVEKERQGGFFFLEPASKLSGYNGDSVTEAWELLSCSLELRSLAQVLLAILQRRPYRTLQMPIVHFKST